MCCNRCTTLLICCWLYKMLYHSFNIRVGGVGWCVLNLIRRTYSLNLPSCSSQDKLLQSQLGVITAFITEPLSRLHTLHFVLPQYENTHVAKRRWINVGNKYSTHIHPLSSLSLCWQFRSQETASDEYICQPQSLVNNFTRIVDYSVWCQNLNTNPKYSYLK